MSTPQSAALSQIGWRLDAPAAEAWQRQPDGRLARVVQQHRSGYIVSDGLREFAVQSPAPWVRADCPPEDRAAVGDWVRLDALHDQILDCLPRHSLFKRAAAGEHYKQQPIAANVDTVFVVTGLDGDFNVRRIERYLVLVQASGARPVLVLTKADCCDILDMVREVLDEAGLDGVPVHALNARDPADVAQLHRYIGPGQTAVLVGSSGAGKSTLTNSLLGHERMKTGAVRARDSRGRHTTTHRALLPLPQGGCLIDTPGMRELKLTGDESVAEALFDDIEALAAQCRFRDCRHGAEPGCAIRQALDDETLDEGRWASYCKLQDERQAAATSQAVLAQKREAARSATRTQPRRGGRDTRR